MSIKFKTINEFYKLIINQNYYFINKSRTELGKRQMKIEGPTIWLRVPHDLKNFSPFSLKKDMKINCLIHIKVNVDVFLVVELF